MANRIVSRTAYIIWLISILVAFSTATFGQAQPTKKQRKEAQNLAEAAKKSLAQRNYRDAVEQFSQSIAIVPNNAEAHFNKAWAHYYLKEYDQALSELEIAANQGIKPIDISKLRYFLRYQNKDYKGALADVRELLKVEPNNVTYILAEADISAALGDSSAALAAYQKAVANDPRNGDLYFKIANLQAKSGNVSEQVSAAEEAIKRNTQYLGDAFALAADGYFKLKRYEEAEQAYMRAIDRWKAAGERGQQIFDAYRTVGDIYRRLNRLNDAIRVTKQAIVDFPNNGMLYTDISWYYSLADRHQDAIDAAVAGVKFSKEPQLAYTNLCRAYNDAGQHQLAITNCNAALRLAPDDGETYFYLGRAYDLTNRPAEATRAYDRAVKGLEKYTRENPDYSDGFYLLGNAYFANGQRDKAIAAYLECLKLSPRFVKARYNLGIIYALNKNKAAAMEQYNALQSLDAALAEKLKIEIDKQ